MTDPEETHEAAIDGFPYEKPGGDAQGRETVEVLATEFLEAKRLGHNPSIDDYVRRYPHAADEIREFFPMISAMERWKHEKEADCLRRHIPENFHVDRLGDCRILREIGRGGMGIVFEAEQEPSGRRVAVKLLPWRAEDVPKARDRFRREADTLEKLRHPNIVPLLSFGEYHDFYYYVMKFVRGVGLDWLISRLKKTDGIVYANEIVELRGPISETPTTESEGEEKQPSPHQQRRLRRGAWKQAATVGLQVANALRYAHTRRILHNDIKPGNLLLDSDGRVWVTDFGLAQSLDQQSLQTDGSLAGTLRYMPPERFVGPGDERSDVYSLGITLYELLTLTNAFEGGTPQQLMTRVTTTEPVPPRAHDAGIPVDLEAIVLKAIARDVDGRYQSAEDLASDLLRFLNDRPPVFAKRGWKQRVTRWFRK